MSTLRAILEFQGCLDTAVLVTQDPRVMETADAFLPGTSANAQWYQEIEAFMLPRGADGQSEHHFLKELGTVARFVGATLQNTTNPTLLKGGYKHNVIPESAEALVDCRTLPGQEEQVLEIVRD